MAATPSSSFIKAYYRPIEAAIRWSGLWEHEQQILGALGGRDFAEPNEFQDWPALRLKVERILDAIVNKDLPCGVSGVTVNANLLLHYPHLTIRHVDLKAWMTRFYPEDRPHFLFNRDEQEAASQRQADNYVRAERDALRSQLQQRELELETLRSSTRRAHLDTKITRDENSDSQLSLRADTTYLNIIGALLDLILGRSSKEPSHSAFRTQEALIATLVESHGDKLGIAQRTLERKFSEAKRKLSNS